MKSFISNLFVVILFVCLSVKHGLSIKCYDCKTKLLDRSTEECRDKLGNSLTRECQSSVCSIVVKTLYNGEGFITRGCGSNSNGTMLGTEITRADHGQYSDNGSHVSWSSCSTDLCNWDVTHEHRIRRQIDGMFKFPPRVCPEIRRDKRDIKCYVCSPDLDDDNKCAQGKEMETKTCHYGGCTIFKVSFQGDDVIRRLCDGPEVDEYLSLLPEDKDTNNDKWKRYGIELSWSTCTTDLCNWGVMNTYQTMTLFVSAMMCLSVYTLF